MASFMPSADWGSWRALRLRSESSITGLESVLLLVDLFSSVRTANVQPFAHLVVWQVLGEIFWGLNDTTDIPITTKMWIQ